MSKNRIFNVRKVLNSHEGWSRVDKEILEAFRYNRSDKEFVRSLSCVREMFFLEEFSASLSRILAEKLHNGSKDYFILVFALSGSLYYTDSTLVAKDSYLSCVEICWHEIGTVYSNKELTSETPIDLIFMMDEDNFQLFLED